MIPLIQTILAGVLGTALMTGTLYAIHWRGFANADMIRAIGSLMTHNEETAIVPGAVVHLVSGVVFAFVYIAVWSTLPGLTSFFMYVVLGLITGFAHGLVVSFVLVVLVAEHHPLPRFQAAGITVALAHLLAHVAYGLMVGVVAGSYAVHLNILPKLA